MMMSGHRSRMASHMFAATSGSQEIQETVEAYLVTVEEVKLDLTGVT